jgi:hypothetical protein
MILIRNLPKDWVDDAFHDGPTSHGLSPRKRLSFRHYICVSDKGGALSFWNSWAERLVTRA